MKSLKVTLVVVMLFSAGYAKADAGPRLDLSDYRAGEFKCPKLIEAELKKADAARAAQAGVAGSISDSAQ